MSTHGLLFTQDDIQRLLPNRRFLAAVHAYSKDIIPLGEVPHRATERSPCIPRWIEILGYFQLIQEVAERIFDGRLTVAQQLCLEYPDAYDSHIPDARRFDHYHNFRFPDLAKNPDLKKRALVLFRRTYEQKDIDELIKDRRVLAGIDAYGKGIISFGAMKELVFGDLHATPRELEFLAFHKLCLDVVPRIRAGTIHVPTALEGEFPEIYHPTPPQHEEKPSQ
jgi:hypothetical protein